MGGGPPPAPVLGPPIDITDETREAEASFAASGDGGPGSVVSVGGPASAGLTINLIFDAAAMAAPQSFRDGITAAMQQICAVVTDKITINIQIDYSGTGGGASAGPTGGNFVGYSTVRADLVNNASPGDTTFNALPTGSTIAGQSQVAVWYAQEKLWGLISPTGTEVDGSATFSTDINPNLLVGVALHELTHAMGRVPYGSQPDVFDFYRFTSAGNYLFNGSSTAPAAYFSLNGGTTKIADYGQTSDPSDFLNSGLQGSTDPFNEFYSGSTQQQLTAIDLKQLDALGFHLVSNQQTVIELFGATKLVQVGANFYLNPASGTGPELKYGGAVFTAGSTWGSWAPIGAEAISGGYEVAFKTGTDTYTVWDTDANGNITTNALGTTSGSSTALEALETSFQQDLNGDHIIGVPAAPPSTTIEALGVTALVQSRKQLFPQSRCRRHRTRAEIWRRAFHICNVGLLGADRCGSDLRRLRGRLQDRHGHVYGLAYRCERQHHNQCAGDDVGQQRRPGGAGNQLPAGSERRPRHRRAERAELHDHRSLRCDGVGSDREQLFPQSGGRRHGSRAEVRRRALHIHDVGFVGADWRGGDLWWL